MLGLMNDCLEKLVISKFGVEVWEAVKERAGCDVKNDGFLKLESYHDDATAVLVECVNELTGLPLDEVYRLYGAHFPEYISEEGYENLLYCQGRTLKEWMASINSIHNHLQTTFPNRIVSPEFWCEENKNGTLSLFYMSSRGHVWAAFVQGLVTECARRQFDLHITMEIVSYQGEQGARFTRYVCSASAVGGGSSNGSRADTFLGALLIPAGSWPQKTPTIFGGYEQRKG
jgi:guanylate cyclase soluble subunit beta